MGSKINIHCDCGLTHEVDRDNDAPENAVSMGCNWCPSCMDDADDYYEEWYNYNDGENYETPDPNQLMMFSITDSILKNNEENIPKIEDVQFKE